MRDRLNMLNDEHVVDVMEALEDLLKETGLPSDSDTWAKLSHTLDSPWTQFARRFIDRTLFAVPRYIHDNLVVPNQKDYPYYHRQYRYASFQIALVACSQVRFNSWQPKFALKHKNYVQYTFIF